MSTNSTLWMGDIEPWMTESFIMKSFNHFNINPIRIKFIIDRETSISRNYCFINFDNIQQASNVLTTLNGKLIPGTSIKFKLNWANYYSTFNKSIYVGNLSPDVDDIVLYNLFKNKYNSVHHASVITDNGKSKGFGFVLFRSEEDYKKCLQEMDGIEFHGNIIKVNEQMKKEDDDSNSNDDNSYIEGQNNYMLNNINNISLNDKANINIYSSQTSDNLLQQHILSDNINNINALTGNNFINNNLLLTCSRNVNTKIFNNIKSNIVNINNPIICNLNALNNIHNLNDVHTTNFNPTNNNNFYNSKNDFNNSNILQNILNKNINRNNFISLYPINEVNSENYSNNNFNQNYINNNNFQKDKKSTLSNKNTRKQNNNKNNKLEILNKYDHETIIEKIRENLNKLYNYYVYLYPGDINKLKCKLNKII